MPLIFKERLDGCSDLYAKIRHAAMVDGKLHSRAIDDQMKLACFGLLSPKKFFGIEVDWTPNVSVGIIVYGVIFIIGSLVLRAWDSDTVNIDKSKVTAIVLKVRVDLPRKSGEAFAQPDASFTRQVQACGYPHMRRMSWRGELFYRAMLLQPSEYRRSLPLLNLRPQLVNRCRPQICNQPWLAWADNSSKNSILLMLRM
jgi:hypothetical protein